MISCDDLKNIKSSSILEISFLKLLGISAYSFTNMIYKILCDYRRIGFDSMVWAVSRAQIGIFMTATLVWPNDEIATKQIMSGVNEKYHFGIGKFENYTMENTKISKDTVAVSHTLIQTYFFIYFTVITLNIDGCPKPFFVPYFMFKEQIVGLNELKRIKIALRTKYIQSTILSDVRYCTWI